MTRRLGVGACALAALFACGGDGRPTRPYDDNDLMLLVDYTAKESCSCLFVMEMGEDYCRAWSKAAPAVATWSFDPDKKTVDAAVGLLWGARAHFVDDQVGCVLE
jgi:hypothetical protein